MVEPGKYTFYWNSFRHDQDLNDPEQIEFNWFRHGEEMLILYVGQHGEAMLQIYYHGRLEDELWNKILEDIDIDIKHDYKSKLYGLPERGSINLDSGEKAVTLNEMKNLVRQVKIKGFAEESKPEGMHDVDVWGDKLEDLLWFRDEEDEVEEDTNENEDDEIEGIAEQVPD